MIRLIKRPEQSQAMIYLSPVIALLMTLISGVILFLFMGIDPGKALYAFFIQPITSIYGLAELCVKATPLVLIGIALSVGFRAGVWNIGAEGQLTLGAICSGGIALWLYDVESVFILPIMIFCGMLGGMLWAAIPAFLRTRFDTNEILTSLMLTYVATLLLSLLVHGPWRNPDGFNFPESRMFNDSAMLPIIIQGTRLHIGWLFALSTVIATWAMMTKTIIGFQVKVIGQAPEAGKYAGFSMNTVIWFTLLLGGACAGLAGLIEVSGPIGQLLPSISPGYGFTAIIVAFVGRLHPIGVLFVGLLLALFYLGGENAQITINLPLAVTGVFQGILLFFLLASDVLINYRPQCQWRIMNKGGNV